jgi:hypothetical protein
MQVSGSTDLVILGVPSVGAHIGELLVLFRHCLAGVLEQGLDLGKGGWLVHWAASINVSPSAVRPSLFIWKSGVPLPAPWCGAGIPLEQPGAWLSLGGAVGRPRVQPTCRPSNQEVLQPAGLAGGGAGRVPGGVRVSWLPHSGSAGFMFWGPVHFGCWRDCDRQAWLTCWAAGGQPALAPAGAIPLQPFPVCRPALAFSPSLVDSSKGVPRAALQNGAEEV